MKKFLLSALGSLAITAVSTILVALIKGEPLDGLVKLEGIYRIFVRMSVPAWLFTPVLFVALVIAQYAASYLWKHRKGEVHFVHDAHNYGWARTQDGRIELRLGGVLTFAGRGKLSILRAFLKGTEPLTDMMVQVRSIDGSGITTIHQLDLPEHEPIEVFINLLLQPTTLVTRMLAWYRQGGPYPGDVVLTDNRNRDFVLDTVKFPYLGRR